MQISPFRDQPIHPSPSAQTLNSLPFFYTGTHIAWALHLDTVIHYGLILYAFPCVHLMSDFVVGFWKQRTCLILCNPGSQHNAGPQPALHKYLVIEWMKRHQLERAGEKTGEANHLINPKLDKQLLNRSQLCSVLLPHLPALAWTSSPTNASFFNLLCFPTSSNLNSSMPGGSMPQNGLTIHATSNRTENHGQPTDTLN